jgi:hypothetical protein
MGDRIEFPCGCVYGRFSGLPEVVCGEYHTCRCRGLRCRPRRLADAALRIREVLQAPPPEGYTAEDRAFGVVSDFLDGFYAHPEVRAELLRDEPPAVGDARWDAYLAALAEHLACGFRLPVPSWVHGPGRTLDRPWFPSGRAFHAISLVESPAAFRKRGIFIDHTYFMRV